MLVLDRLIGLASPEAALRRAVRLSEQGKVAAAFPLLTRSAKAGIADAEYKVAFEIDEIDPAKRTGWSVMIQGAAHYVDDEEERAAVLKACIEPWVGGERELYLRIRPTLVTGRRVRRG